jgi:hypothetical protein
MEKMNYLQRACLFLFLLAFSVSGTFKAQINRKMLKASASFAAAICVGNPQLSFAANEGMNDIQCTFKLSDAASATKQYGQGSDSAIFLVVKQDTSLEDSNGKPTPVLFSSITPVKNSKSYVFPTETTLNSQNGITKEGLKLQRQWQSGKLPLIVTAILDVDGRLNTQSNKDIVVKKTITKDIESKKWGGCNIEF